MCIIIIRHEFKSIAAQWHVSSLYQEQRRFQLSLPRGYFQVYVFGYSGRKKAWTTEEDEYLKKLVGKYGAQKWTIIA